MARLPVTPVTIPLPGFYADPSARYHGAIVSAHGVEKQVTPFIDVFDYESQFVEMAGQENGGVPLRIQGGDPVSQHIPLIGIGLGSHELIKYRLRFPLVPRRGPAGQQFDEKFRNLILVFCHEHQSEG